MNDKFESMINLIDELTNVLVKLADMQRQVVAAVGEDNLEKLADCMKHEQVLSLTLRNIEQKRLKLQDELGFKEIKLSELPSKVKDAEMQIRIRNTANKLSAQYKIVKSTSETARSILEANLRRVEQTMKKIGVDPSQTQINSGIHTDFHA